MSDAPPTPCSTLAAGYVRVLVWCKACRHRADADLPALVSAGRGDTPFREFRPSAPSLIEPEKRECWIRRPRSRYAAIGESPVSHSVLNRPL